MSTTNPVEINLPVPNAVTNPSGFARPPRPKADDPPSIVDWAERHPGQCLTAAFALGVAIACIVKRN